MTQPIDVAYVDIVARTKEFRREIKDIIDDEVRDLERELSDVLDEVDKHFASTAKEADKAFSEIEETVRDTADIIEDEIGDALRKIDLDADGVRRTVGSNFDKMFLHAAQNGQFVERRVVPIWRQALKLIGDSATSAFSTAQSAAGAFFSSLSGGSLIIAGLIVVLPALVALLVTLGAALADLTGLLALIPAGLSVLAATIAPLIIGFQNFGEALGAILSGDKEKITETLKKLTPAARSVAKEFTKLIEPFRQLQRSVQEALFAPLVGQLTKLVTTVIDPLRSGLSLVAGTLGEIIAHFITLLGSAEGVQLLNDVFSTTNDILRVLGPALVALAGAFFKLIVASLPAVELLSTHFANALIKFAEFLTKSIEDGTFKAFIDDALATLKQILALGGAIIDFFGALFTQETADAGRAILQTLTDVFNVMTKFLQTPEGKQFLADLATLALVAIHVLSGLVIIFGTILQTTVETIVAVLDFFGIVDRGLHETAQTSVNTGNTIVAAIGSVPGRLIALSGHFATAGARLIASFIGGFRQSGNFINDVAGDIVRGVKSGLNRFISTINSGIAQLDALLPFSLSRIPSLAAGGIVGARPGGVLAQIAEGGQDEVVAPLDDLRKIISDVVGGQTITFESGAINVSFSGVVPTQAEARSTGESIGEGILATLSRRNVRAQVRAI